MRDLEYCAECGNPTGRAGRLDDSLYPGGEGPYCEDCYDEWPDWKVSEIATLRQQLSTTQAENGALKAQLKEAEEKGRVLMDMCRDLRKRVTELSEILQIAVDTPEFDGGTWYWPNGQKAIDK